MREELLEYIFEHSKEDCLSDLRNPAVFRMHMVFITKIDDQKYSIDEWNQLISYICGHIGRADNVKEAKEMLNRWAIGKK